MTASGPLADADFSARLVDAPAETLGVLGVTPTPGAHAPHGVLDGLAERRGTMTDANEDDTAGLARSPHFRSGWLLVCGRAGKRAARHPPCADDGHGGRR